MLIALNSAPWDKNTRQSTLFALSPFGRQEDEDSWPIYPQAKWRLGSMFKRPDHGLSESDINTFMHKMLAEAVEKSWMWKHSVDWDIKAELEIEILEMLVSCYMLSMWSDAAFSLEVEDEESLASDFD